MHGDFRIKTDRTLKVSNAQAKKRLNNILSQRCSYLLHRPYINDYSTKVTYVEVECYHVSQTVVSAHKRVKHKTCISLLCKTVCTGLNVS
jgi:hypothetical protein